MAEEHPNDTIQLIGAKVTFVPMDERAGYELTEWDVEPGAQGPPIHIHHEHDEGFYVIAGHFGFILDGITTCSCSSPPHPAWRSISARWPPAWATSTRKKARSHSERS